MAARARSGTRRLRPLRRVDPVRRRGWAYRAYAAFVGSRLGTVLSRWIGWRLDPHLLRITRGRLGFGLVLPTAVLETVGAKTGLPRRHAVLYFHDRDRVVIVASKAGDTAHPAWFHNLRAHPTVVFGGHPMVAAVVDDAAERDRLWGLADRVFAPYARYRRRAAKAGRTIPIVHLTPR